LITTLYPEFSVFVSGLAFVSLLSLVPVVEEKTLLDGSAVPCADSRETTSGVPGVRVNAFNATKIPALRKSLDVLDSLDWESGNPDAMLAAAVEYKRLMTLVKRAPKIGYAMSNGNGDFEIMVAPTDSVLVFAEARMPGQPFYYSSKVVAATVPEVRIVLLMCSQQLL